MKFSLLFEYLILHINWTLKLFLQDLSFSDIYTNVTKKFPLGNYLRWLRKDQSYLEKI